MRAAHGGSELEIGCCLAAFADRPFHEAIRSAAELGFAVVDLPTDSVFELARSTPAATEVRRLADEHGISIAAVSNSRDAQLLLGPHGDVTDGVCPGPPAEKAEHALAAARRTIALAAAVGARHARLMLGCPDYARWLRWPGSPSSWDANVARFVEAVCPLIEEAGSCDVRVCIEPHVKQVPFDVPSLRACLDGVRSAGLDLDVCFDPANVAALGFDPVDFLTAIDVVPAMVHAKDLERAAGVEAPSGPGWVRYGPQPAVRFRSVPWGQLGWSRLVTALDRSGFTGPVLVEHEDVLIDPATGLVSARHHLEAMPSEASTGQAWW